MDLRFDPFIVGVWGGPGRLERVGLSFGRPGRASGDAASSVNWLAMMRETSVLMAPD